MGVEYHPCANNIDILVIISRNPLNSMDLGLYIAPSILIFTRNVQCKKYSTLHALNICHWNFFD